MHTFLPAHRISYETIRSLAIECHALDLSAFTLFVDGTHGSSRSTKIAYEELLSSKLLMLAISLRTKFYQGVSHSDSVDYVIDCGFLDSNSKGIVVERSFSIKDVCDKLIHADEVKRDFTDEKNGLLTILHGNAGGSAWTFHISMSLFAESVLNWLDDLPDA
jgi:hypothetical protein